MSPLPDILIDVTMTAVRRPEVLKRTLHSFYINMLAPVIDRCRLIINIDPVGDEIPSYALCDIASAFFSRFTVGMPLEPSFPKAFAWTWQRVEAPYVLHLEDDWELLAPVQVQDMVDLMEEDKKLASLRLPFFPSGETSMRNWNLDFPWNGRYFECPAKLRQAAGFAGHPSLLRGQFVKNCAPMLDIRLNPEKQFHSGNPSLVEEVLKWKFGVWGKPNQSRIIADIGTVWKQDNKFTKKGNKAFFTQWEKFE